MQAAVTTINDVARGLFDGAYEIMEKTKEELLSSEMMRAEHSDVEEMLKAGGNEWMRMMMQAYLDARTEQEQKVEVCGKDGVMRGKAVARGGKWKRCGVK